MKMSVPQTAHTIAMKMLIALIHQDIIPANAMRDTPEMCISVKVYLAQEQFTVILYATVYLIKCFTVAPFL